MPDRRQWDSTPRGTDGRRTTLVVVGGATHTASISGISAAGATESTRLHTPSADLEIVSYGSPVRSPVVPVSPTGCPTPAIVTRAIHDELGFDVVTVDAGLARPTGAPAITVGTEPGGDLREGEPVPDADEIIERSHRLGRALETDELVVGETIPGGTTTALGVLTALGEPATVSSSLPSNPVDAKRRAVDAALSAADRAPGSIAGEPVEAVRRTGDPVLAAIAGLVRGATTAGRRIVLAGGTQLAAAGALVRHAGVGEPLELATTSFVADDPTARVDDLAGALDLSLTVTDPGFDRTTHPATDAYVRGEAKEGVGMGGALAIADRAGVPMADVRERTVALYDHLVDDGQRPEDTR